MALDFEFGPRRRAIDLDKFKGLNLATLVSSLEGETGEALQPLLEELVFGDLDAAARESSQRRGRRRRRGSRRYYDEVDRAADVRHAFRAVQMALEYQLFVQELCLSDGESLKGEVEDAQLKIRALENDIAEEECNIKRLQSVRANRRRVVATYESLIRQQNLTNGQRNKIIVAQKCHICGKAFASSKYLDDHMSRAHPGEVARTPCPVVQDSESTSVEIEVRRQDEKRDKALVQEMHALVTENSSRVQSVLRSELEALREQLRKTTQRSIETKVKDAVATRRRQRRVRDDRERAEAERQIRMLRAERARDQERMEVRMHHFELDIARQYALKYRRECEESAGMKLSVSTSVTGLPISTVASANTKDAETDTSHIGEMERDDDDDGCSDIAATKKSLDHELAEVDILRRQMREVRAEMTSFEDREARTLAEVSRMRNERAIFAEREIARERAISESTRVEIAEVRSKAAEETMDVRRQLDEARSLLTETRKTIARERERSDDAVRSLRREIDEFKDASRSSKERAKKDLLKENIDAVDVTRDGIESGTNEDADRASVSDAAIESNIASLTTRVRDSMRSSVSATHESYTDDSEWDRALEGKEGALPSPSPLRASTPRTGEITSSATERYEHEDNDDLRSRTPETGPRGAARDGRFHGSAILDDASFLSEEPATPKRRLLGSSVTSLISDVTDSVSVADSTASMGVELEALKRGGNSERGGDDENRTSLTMRESKDDKTLLDFGASKRDRKLWKRKVDESGEVMVGVVSPTSALSDNIGLADSMEVAVGGIESEEDEDDLEADRTVYSRKDRESMKTLRVLDVDEGEKTSHSQDVHRSSLNASAGSATDDDPDRAFDRHLAIDSPMGSSSGMISPDTTPTGSLLSDSMAVRTTLGLSSETDLSVSDVTALSVSGASVTRSQG
eukprot:g1915.t1